MSQVSRRSMASLLALTISAGTALLFVGAGPAAAAADGPRAQAVGRYLDGQLGPQTLESVVNLKDARASNPGTVTDQNPLDVVIGGQGDIPLSGSAQSPGQGDAAHFGGANQVARAQSNGYAYGASGAVANSGGASVGGNNNAYPATASFDLSASDIPNNPSIPIPGAPDADALGGVSIDVGAVSALASTPAGFKKAGSTKYGIGTLKLTIGSPALGQLLATLAGALDPGQLDTVLGSLPVPGGVPLPASCSLTTVLLPKSLSLAGGAITISATDATISVDLVALLHELGADINKLPANTDLLDYLTNYLTSTKGLSTGIQSAINDSAQQLQDQFDACQSALPGGAAQIIDALNGGRDTLQSALAGLLGQLAGAGGGGNPLAPLADGLKSLLDLGANVVPNAAHGSFQSALKATPDQDDDPISGQVIVRAIEINLIPAAGDTPAATIALANAAAGPSTPPSAVPSTSTPRPTPSTTPPATPDTHVPTGVPAGQGTTGTTPHLAILLLVLAVALGGVGAMSWRLRSGRHGS